MDFKKARSAIRKVARQYGISEETVILEIEYAISEAMAEAKRMNDGRTLAKWREIPCLREEPNAYELVTYLADKLNTPDVT